MSYKMSFQVQSSNIAFNDFSVLNLSNCPEFKDWRQREELDLAFTNQLFKKRNLTAYLFTIMGLLCSELILTLVSMFA